MTMFTGRIAGPHCATGCKYLPKAWSQVTYAVMFSHLLIHFWLSFQKASFYLKTRSSARKHVLRGSAKDDNNNWLCLKWHVRRTSAPLLFLKMSVATPIYKHRSWLNHMYKVPGQPGNLSVVIGRHRSGLKLSWSFWPSHSIFSLFIYI